MSSVSSVRAFLAQWMNTAVQQPGKIVLCSPELYQQYKQNDAELVTKSVFMRQLSRALREQYGISQRDKKFCYHFESRQIGQTQPSASNHDSKRPSIPKRVRELVWNTYVSPYLAAHRCFCCKKNMIRMTEFHCGHVIPHARGGSLSVENLRPICQSCNLSMGTRTMIEFIETHKLFF